MKRKIQQWQNCNPAAMAREMSEAAQLYAFEDAQADILELHEENKRFKLILKAVAYPKRNTTEEASTLQDFADLIQQIYTLEQLTGEDS